MEQYLTEFESIVQRRENSTQSTYEGCTYDKLSEVLLTGNYKNEDSSSVLQSRIQQWA